MRVLITGVDGYLGWSLAQYLAARGHEVAGIDALLRRRWVAERGSRSALPIADMPTRLRAFEERWGRPLHYRVGDLTDWELVASVFEESRPEAIVHLGECPSAAYSMIDLRHATWVQTNNLVGTMNILYAVRDITPDAHLIKLGTMGEYGTPGVEIPEGFFEVAFRGRRARLPFPRQAGSWYHWSKVHGSNNIMFASKLWGLRSTDIMQGVVYGTRIDEMGDDERLLTRLDFDECFGTAINRFCCQAVLGEPLTLFGKGHQKRGFLPLRDSMQCLTLTLENPPARGEYRVFNQFEEAYDISALAHQVRRVAGELGLATRIRHLENPRWELEEHFYAPDHQHLLDLGYRPTRDMAAELRVMLADLLSHRERIAGVRHVLIPEIRWRGAARKVVALDRIKEPGRGTVAGDPAASDADGARTFSP